MRWIDVIRIAIRMLRTNLLRSLLTILGIGVAISFIVILIGFGYGLQTITIGSILQSKELLSLDVRADDKTGSVIGNQTVAELRQLAGVTGASPVIITSGQIQIGPQLAAVAVSAGNQDYLEMEGVQIQTGQAFKDGQRQVVVSPAVLDLVNLSPLQALGQIVTMSYTDPNNASDLKKLDNLVIVGISGSTDGPTVFLSYELLNPEGTAKLSLIKLVVKDRPAVLSIRDRVTQKGYQVESLVDTLDEARRVFGYATVGLVTFGIIALIVASIGMFNTLTIALIERTREIGVMKAIGVTDRAVKRLFLAEAAIIGLFGGFFGTLIGIMIGLTIEMLVNRLAVNNQALPLDLFQYPPGFLLGIILFPVLLSILTGLYPAIRAAKLNPLQALRYE